MSTEIFISPRLQTALDWAEGGWHVIPLRYGTKDGQLLKSWKKEATRDPATIRRWAQQFGDFNVAAALQDGESVVDADTVASQQAGVDLGLPETFTTLTAGGGEHLFYFGTLPNRSHTLGPSLDTRGQHGYALLPGSMVLGRYLQKPGRPKLDDDTLYPYTIKHNRPVADLPAHVAALAVKAKIPPRPAPENHNPDQALFEARAWLKTQAPPEAGDGDNGIYRAMAKLYDYYMDYEQRIALIDEAWPDRKPMNVLMRVSASIERGNIQNEQPGTSMQAPSVEAFAHMLEQAPAPLRILRGPRERRLVANPAWLLQPFLPEMSSILLYSESGAGKTLFATYMVLSIVTGKEFCGVAPASIGPVVYVALEGLRGLESTRLKAWLKQHGDLEDPEGFYTTEAPVFQNDWGDAFIAQLKSELPCNPKLIVLDTYSNMMAYVDQMKDGGRAAEFIKRLIREFQCSVLVLGHSGKDPSKGHRGSTEFPAGMNSRIVITGDHKDEMRMRVKVEHHKDHKVPKTMFFISEERDDSIIIEPCTYDEYHKRAPSKGGPPRVLVAPPL